MSNYVFVYGTLQRNERNSLSRWPDAYYIGPAVTVHASYSMVDFGPFPAVITGGKYRVAGELWEVTDDIIVDLDRIEGYPSFYDRIQVMLSAQPGIIAYMYVMHDTPVDTIEVIPNGGIVDW